MKNLILYDLKRDMHSGIGLFYLIGFIMVFVATEVFATTETPRIQGVIFLCFLLLCFLLFLTKLSNLTRDFVTSPTHIMLIPKSKKQLLQSHSIVIFLYSLILGMLLVLIVLRLKYDTPLVAIKHISIFEMTLFILFTNAFVLTISLVHMVIRKYIPTIYFSLIVFLFLFVFLLYGIIQVFENHMEFVMINGHWVMLSLIIVPFILIELTSFAMGHKLKY